MTSEIRFSTFVNQFKLTCSLTFFASLFCLSLSSQSSGIHINLDQYKDINWKSTLELVDLVNSETIQLNTIAASPSTPSRDRLIYLSEVKFFELFKASMQISGNKQHKALIDAWEKLNLLVTTDPNYKNLNPNDIEALIPGMVERFQKPNFPKTN